LTTLDISNLNTSKAKSMREMFHGKKNLKELDLSSLDTSNVENCLSMFHDFQRNCTIKISNKFTKCREQIPYENLIINVDDLACNRFDNCEKCSGSKDTLQCIKCKIGYQIINNICIKPICNLGENEKCLSCQNIPGKEDECLECNVGYYLPSNNLDKTKCSKCQIEGCKRCDNFSGKCLECKYNYEPITDENSGIIINCNLQCEIGMGNKCLTCQTEKGKKNQCSSCNTGYKLINGQCKKIENSFVAIYNVTSTSEFTRIMCISENNIKLSDFDMYVNGNKVNAFIDQGRWRSWMDEDYIAYIFPTLGKNEVKIIFNKTLTDMKYLFVDCYDLISIDFNEAFDTSHVLCMFYMFSSCDSLEHINISSFNTSIVGDMEGMFTGCDSLTSLDLSNFDTKNVYFMQCIFAYSEKLSYLDISSFDTTYLGGGGWMFDDLPENGTVIIGPKFNRQSSLPNGWKIIKKNN
jgi:surface protein